MKVKLALAAAAIMGAFAVSVPSQAAPLSGAGIATEAAKTDAKPMEQVHRRYYRGRHWRGRIGAIAVTGTVVMDIVVMDTGRTTVAIMAAAMDTDIPTAGIAARGSISASASKQSFV